MPTCSEYVHVLLHVHIVIHITFAMYIYVGNWLCDKVYENVHMQKLDIHMYIRTLTYM